MSVRALLSNRKLPRRLVGFQLVLLAAIALPASASGGEAKATLRIELAVVPSLESGRTQPAPPQASSGGILWQTPYNVLIERRELQLSSISGASQQPGSGPRSSAVVLETVTVVSP